LNAFDFALQMELDGERYYREQAQKSSFEDLKIVFEGLADDEQRHYKIVQSIQNQTGNYLKPDPALDTFRTVFASYKDDLAALNAKVDIKKLRDEQLDVYRVALAKESESVNLYKKLEEQAEKVEDKKIFENLRSEEEQHQEVLDTIVAMLNNVSDWVEAAEFGNRGRY